MRVGSDLVRKIASYHEPVQLKETPGLKTLPLFYLYMIQRYVALAAIPRRPRFHVLPAKLEHINQSTDLPSAINVRTEHGLL